MGQDNFLLAYGLGLLKYGYWDSPLEIMARKYTEKFLGTETPFEVEPLITAETNQILNQLNI